MNRQLLFLLLCLISFSACQIDSTTEIPEQNRFFDLKAYFQKEKIRLQQFKEFSKETLIDGQTESKTFSELNFDTELQIFENADINRVAWLDKYQVDSIIANGQVTRIEYKAHDPKLKTRQLDIDFDSNKEVRRISIQKESNSVILKSKQNLLYQPQTGYSIESLQKLPTSDEKQVKVSVRFK